MPSADLQALVNDIAERLDAPAVLEDEEQRMIVYSSHTTRTPMDEVRRDSILRRETQQPVRDWFRGFGITVSTGPIRIPSAERLGILGRLCVPIRSHGLLTGFLWLIDDRGALSAEQVGIAEHAATQAGLLMLEDVLAEKRGTGALRQLLSASDELRTAAARQVRDEGLLPGTAPAAIAVVQVVGEGSGARAMAGAGAGAGAGAAGDGAGAVDGGDAGVRLTISEALADVTRRHESGALLGLAFRDHLAMLLRVNGGPSRTDRAREIGCETREAMARRLTRGGSRARVVVGIGDPCGLLEESYHSYRQARLAASTAAEIPSFGTVARWRDLGVYRAISLLPGPEAADAALDPRFGQLLAAGDSGVLEALETYLDLCGDGQAAAERLYLHRGTLYYRLKKAQRICGINLHDGRDRLAIHLAFKIARSTGRYPG